jgi:Zn-dependent protease with chaperone function
LVVSLQISFLGVTLEGSFARQVFAVSGRDQLPVSTESSQQSPLRGLLQKSYAELFDLAPTLEYRASEIEAQRQALGKGKDFCVSRFKTHGKQYGKEIDVAQKDLKKKTATMTEGQRSQIHCKIQNLELLRSEAQALSGHAIPTAYSNLNAKLDVIEKWPALYKQTKQERKRSGLLPPEVEDKTIQEYVNSVAQRIAQKSDLRIPLHVTVLQSREINAFALPGGYLFLERGLLEAADDESELAGVIAHEMAHDAARHANKLIKRATIAGIFYQAAQIAAMILTGGVAGIGTYYALQYGFYGLGLVLNLNLLGVSRDYEMEADQLGIQYSWNAGYDPSGFIRFFDKIATREGYVNGASWFRTHPPFYQRMVDTRREIMFLPGKPDVIVQTSAFEQMKKQLAPIAAAANKEEMGKPSLKITREQGCEPPKRLEYTPGQPIEELCAAGFKR